MGGSTEPWDGVKIAKLKKHVISKEAGKRNAFSKRVEEIRGTLEQRLFHFLSSSNRLTTLNQICIFQPKFVHVNRLKQSA